MSIDRSEPVQQTLSMYAKLLKKGLSHDPPAESTKFLLKRFENPQNAILNEFEDADSERTLSRANSLVGALLQTHADMWKAAIENDSLETLDLLRQLLKNIFQFEEYKYSSHGVNPQGAQTADLSFDQKKQSEANNFRRQVEALQFAAYGWGIHLYTEGDLPKSSAKQILEELLMKDFNSIGDLSGAFFRIRESNEIEEIWERWNLDRELKDNFGFAFTGISTDTWLLKFYCSTLIWLVDKKDNMAISSLDAQNSPILDYSKRAIHVDSVIENLESYKEEYPLSELLDDDSAIEYICDSLVGYFVDIKSAFEEQERKWTRKQEINNDIVQKFTKRVNTEISNNTFRRSIINTNGIRENPEVNEKDLDGFSIAGKMPRRLFIDTRIQTSFHNKFSRLSEKYRKFVINSLSFGSEQISSYNSLPGSLDNIISKYDVEFIITGGREVANTLRDHKKSNRVSNEELNSYLEYSNVPVLNEFTDEFFAIAIFSEEYEYVEPSVDKPISIDTILGENVSDWNKVDAPEEFDPRDWVKITFSYKAKIESSSQNGVLLEI